MTDKLVSMAEAIERFVPDGASVALGTAQESHIPFAAGHELVRQGKRDLTLIGPISDMLFDQLIGAGCVKKIQAAWIGNVITGSSYMFRRAVESGELEVEDFSNLAMVMALLAGALGVPFMPLRSTLGSSLPDTNPQLGTVDCPFTGEKLAAVRAIVPDVTIVHAQRADANGNAHLWGSLGITRQAVEAANSIIVTAEEIVAPEVITSDPNRTLVPGFRVAAVVEAAWGAHPSPLPGYYNRDHETFIDYRNQTSEAGGYDLWKAEWVDDVQTLAGYRTRLGESRMDELSIKQSAPSATVDFGY